jgi:phage FluMu gp28-like protein
MLQHRAVVLPRDREVVAQIHSIKRRVLPSGKVSFDAESTGRGGHADRFWSIVLACQKERATPRSSGCIVTARIVG